MKQQQRGTAQFLRLLNPGSCRVADGSMSELLASLDKNQLILTKPGEKVHSRLVAAPWVGMEKDWAEQA